MTTPEFILHQADSPGVFFFDRGEHPRVVRVTDRAFLAMAWPSRREAEQAASDLPGKWTAIRADEVPPRKP